MFLGLEFVAQKHFWEDKYYIALATMKRNKTFVVCKAPPHVTEVISSRKLQSLTSCTPPAADRSLEERISLTV